MKIERQQPPKEFVPVVITIESEAELICMRAVTGAARRGHCIDYEMRNHWLRKESAGRPQPHDAEAFCKRLDDAICEEIV